jgi:WD40 repeat protein
MSRLSCSSYAGGASIPRKPLTSHSTRFNGCHAYCDFVFPGLDGFVFVAWGSEDGLVFIGYYCTTEAAACGSSGVDLNSLSSYDDESNVSQGKPSASMRDVPLRTVLVLPLVGPSPKENSSADARDAEYRDLVHHVAFGGGPEALLLAASGTYLSVFRLDTLLYDMLGSSDPDTFFGNSLDEIERNYQILGMNACEPSGLRRIIAVSWTNRLDGILVSISGGESGGGALKMLELRVDSSNIDKYSMSTIWEIPTKTQHIIQAGVSAHSPCLTATGDEMMANVWWYKGDGSVLCEELKHPVKVVDVQWSPGILQKELISEEGSPDHGAMKEDHPAIMTMDTDGCIRIWVEMMVMMAGNSCECYFAMNLMIPRHVLAAQNVRATWVNPVDHAFQRSHSLPSHHRVLWLVVSCGDIILLYALRGLAPVVVSSTLISGGSSNSGDGAGCSPATSLRSHAVDRPKKPQFLLWGEYIRESSASYDLSNGRLSARMLHGDDFPVVDCVSTGIDEQQRFLLTSGVSFVTAFREEDSSKLQSLTGVHRGIHLERAWSGYGRLRGSPVMSNLVMRRFVVSVDETGCLDVWSCTKDRNFLTYYGSLQLDFETNPGDFKGAVVMNEICGMPAGYDSVILVKGRWVFHVVIGIAQKDVGVLYKFRLHGESLIHPMKLKNRIVIIGIEEQNGKVICELYEYDVGAINQPTAPKRIVLPIFLGGGEELVLILDAEKRHNIMIGTSSGRLFLVGLDKLLGCASEEYPVSGMTSFLIDPFHRLDYDPIHGFFAAIGLDSTVSLYKIVSGNHWQIVPSGKIRWMEGDLCSIKWMFEEILPCIAIENTAGRISIFALDNASFDEWTNIAEFHVSGGATSAALSYAKSCLLFSSGTVTGALGSSVRDSNGYVSKLGKVLLERSGPLPLYHPSTLMAIILSGRIHAFFDVLAHLKRWIDATDVDESLDSCSGESLELLSPSAVQARANASPEMFPGVSPDSFITTNSSTISLTLERLSQIFAEKALAQPKIEALVDGAPKPQAPALDTGMLDMSAFGMETAKSSAPALDTGMLDMSAFGMETAKPSAPALDTGMLDMSAFGMETAKPSAPALDTGMLDMSAFGMETAKPSAPAQDTGMLDMSAFGLEPPNPPLMVSPPIEPSEKHDTPKGPLKRCIVINNSAKISMEEFTGFNMLLDQLLVIMQAPQHADEQAYRRNQARCIPGLGKDVSERLVRSLYRTRKVISMLTQDIDVPSFVFLLGIAFGDASSDTSSHIPPTSTLDRTEFGRVKSVVNAAGVSIDIGPGDLQTPDSAMVMDLPGKLGLGPLVSLESLVWMCLSPQNGLKTVELATEILGDMIHKKNTKDEHVFNAAPKVGTGQLVNTWEYLRSTGLAFWQQDEKILISLLEKCAKATFRETRDPDSVALIYAAIRKIPVLRGLYRTCNRVKEADFFSRDFSKETNRTAACKNAFVLLGQHRYAMAATFFILGGQANDAVEICLQQMDDVQLAIVLYRTLGCQADVDSLLADLFRPYEHLSSSHFLRHWVSGNYHHAVRSLLTVRHPSEAPWLIPVLVQLISTAVTSHDKNGLLGPIRPMDTPDTTQMMFDACTLSADILSRHGMPLLGLDLELIASRCFKNSYGRWKNEVCNSCALSLIQAPVSLIPDQITEDDFNQQISELIDRIEGLQKLGIDVSTNVVLYRIENIYKSLSYFQTVTSPGTPKSPGGSRQGSFLARTHSTDTQSRNSGFSSFRRTSLDEQQQFARMITRSKTSIDPDQLIPQIVYPKGVEIFRADSDMLYSVTSCPLFAPEVCGRLIAVSTPRNGILEFATHPDVPILQHDNLEDVGTPFQDTPRHGSPKDSNSVFSKFVSQIFDQTSWMTDPLENTSMIDGDVGLAVHSTIHSETETGQQSGKMDEAKNTFSEMLVSHPHRQLFLSGCQDTARIKLWQYDGPRPLRLFTPVTYDDLQQLGSQDMFSLSSNFSKSRSLASKMSHWGKAVDMCFSENGERFASVGEGGVVALWSLSGGFSKYSDVDGATCSEWWHTCLSSQGRSVAFVGGSSVVIAAAGSCKSGNISMWNTSLPDKSACVGIFSHHNTPVNKIKTLPGGWLLAAADDVGNLSLSDVRMLGSKGKDTIIWSTKACKGSIRAIDTISYDAKGSGRPYKHYHLPAGLGTGTALVTGGDDGIVRLWDVNSGTLLQQSEKIYSTTPKSSRILSLASGEGKYAITGISVCEEGILSSGTDGVVRLFPRL